MADAILAQSGIYAFTNKLNGKRYVGSAINLRRRYKKHLSQLNNGNHHSAKFQHAWAKYGAEQFEFIVLELVEDPSALIGREQFWIDSYDAFGAAGYNMCPKAGSILGVKRSQATIKKMRASGLKYVASDATREKLRIANSGKKATPEKLEKMRNLVKSPETLEKLRLAGLGRKLSEESIRKMREWNLGRKRSPESIEKMRLAKIGSKWSPETRARIMQARIDSGAGAKTGAAQRGRKQSPETIAKRVAQARITRNARKAAMTPEDAELRRLARKPSPETIAKRVASSAITRASKKAATAN